MKQHITKKQWEELSIKQRRAFYKGVKPKRSTEWHITLGELIEFLGEDLIRIVLSYNYFVDVKGENGRFESEELIDALWEAVKYKLNQK